MRPAQQCRCQKAFFAAPAGRPIPKVGSAAPTAVSMRYVRARMGRSGSSCSGKSRSTNSVPVRRTRVAPALAVPALLGPTPDRSNSSESADAMAALNGRSNVTPSRNALPSCVHRRNRRRHLQRESGRGAVAAEGAVPDAERKLRRARRSSKRHASLALHVRHVLRAHRKQTRKAEHLAPRVTARSGGDASGGVGAAATADRKASRQRRRRQARHQSGTLV
jgi:hypothetical protein